MLKVDILSIEKLKNKTIKQQEDATKKAAYQAIKDTTITAKKQSRLELTRSKHLNLKGQALNYPKNRVFSKRFFKQKNPHAVIFFSNKEEIINKFRLKIRKELGRDKRKRPTVIARILGKEVKSGLTFIRNNLTLARQNKDKKSHKPETSGVSLSDILRQDKSLIDKISAQANERFEKRFNHHLKYYLKKV